MPTIDQFKEQETPPTPLFIFDCVLASGVTVRWSTHAVTVGGNAYPARLLKHNLAALVASSDQEWTARKDNRHSGQRGFVFLAD